MELNSPPLQWGAGLSDLLLVNSSRHERMSLLRLRLRLTSVLVALSLSQSLESLTVGSQLSCDKDT